DIVLAAWTRQPAKRTQRVGWSRKVRNRGPGRVALGRRPQATTAKKLVQDFTGRRLANRLLVLNDPLRGVPVVRGEVRPNRSSDGHWKDRLSIESDRQIEDELAKRRFSELSEARGRAELAQRLGCRVIDRGAGGATRLE